MAENSPKELCEQLQGLDKRLLNILQIVNQSMQLVCVDPKEFDEDKQIELLEGKTEKLAILLGQIQMGFAQILSHLDDSGLLDIGVLPYNITCAASDKELELAMANLKLLKEAMQ